MPSPPGTDGRWEDGRKLLKGVGYTVIYRSQTGKIRLVERSTNGTVIRCTVVRQNGETREVLYEKVDHSGEINRIESQGRNWKICGVNGNSNYIIMWQLNAEEKQNGYVKTVEKPKASVDHLMHRVDADPRDWTYYKKRKETGL